MFGEQIWPILWPASAEVLTNWLGKGLPNHWKESWCMHGSWKRKTRNRSSYLNTSTCRWSFRCLNGWLKGRNGTVPLQNGLRKAKLSHLLHWSFTRHFLMPLLARSWLTPTRKSTFRSLPLQHHLPCRIASSWKSRWVTLLMLRNLVLFCSGCSKDDLAPNSKYSRMVEQLGVCKRFNLDKFLLEDCCFHVLRTVSMSLNSSVHVVLKTTVPLPRLGSGPLVTALWKWPLLPPLRSAVWGRCCGGKWSFGVLVLAIYTMLILRLLGTSHI